MNFIHKVLKIISLNKKNKCSIKSFNISLDADYGKYVSVGYGSYIGKGVSIGKYTYIGKNSSLDNCQIGKYCSISSNVNISPYEHRYTYATTHPILYNKKYGFVDKNNSDISKKVIIGNDVLISLNVVILEGVNIGDGAIIGAGAVVTKDIEPYEIVGGVPAKHIKYRFEKEKRDRLLEIKWWEWDDNKIRENIDLLINWNELY